MTGWALVVDFGTSNTVAVVRVAGRWTPLLFDGSPLLPSAVCLPPEAELLVGRDAERSAAVAPDRLEPNPKRRIDDRTLWLGNRELPVVDVFAAVLRRVVDEATKVIGSPATEAVLTHPAAWGGPRLEVLTEAARRAGLGRVRLVPEPVAAASYYVTVLRQQVPVGGCLVVYDLGAGTFDVAVVRRTGTGFEVLSADGLPDVGGLDLDAAIVNHLRSLTNSQTQTWARLDWPDSPGDRRARLLLWQNVRAAKEQLSRHPRADLHVPLLDKDMHLTRDEFDVLATPLLTRTVDTTTMALRTAGIGREQIAGVFLVGGGSRIPLAASLLHRALHIAPAALDQPELVVATGANATTLPDTDEKTPPTTVNPPSTTEPVVSPVSPVEATTTPSLPTPPARLAPPAASGIGSGLRHVITGLGAMTLTAGIVYHGEWLHQLAGHNVVAAAPILGMVLCTVAGLLMFSRRAHWAGLGLVVGYAALDALTVPFNPGDWDKIGIPWSLFNSPYFESVRMASPTAAGRIALFCTAGVAAVLILLHAIRTPPRRPANMPLAVALLAAGAATAMACPFAIAIHLSAIISPGHLFPNWMIALVAAILTTIAVVQQPVSLGIGLLASWLTVASSYLILCIISSVLNDSDPAAVVVFGIGIAALLILTITYGLRSQRRIAFGAGVARGSR